MEKRFLTNDLIEIFLYKKNFTCITGNLFEKMFEVDVHT